MAHTHTTGRGVHQERILQTQLMGVMHEADDAYSEHLFMLLGGPISHISIQYMDFVEIFNISLHLSAIYFACFNGR